MLVLGSVSDHVVFFVIGEFSSRDLSSKSHDGFMGLKYCSHMNGRLWWPSPYMDPMGLGSFWWIGVRCFFFFKNIPLSMLGVNCGPVVYLWLRRSLKWLPGSPKIVAQLNGKLFGMEGFLCGLWVSWVGYGPTKGGKLCGKEWRLHEVCGKVKVVLRKPQLDKSSSRCLRQKRQRLL